MFLKEDDDVQSVFDPDVAHPGQTTSTATYFRQFKDYSVQTDYHSLSSFPVSDNIMPFESKESNSTRK